MPKQENSILDHKLISDSYSKLEKPFFVQSGKNKLAYFYKKVPNSEKTIIHFHGNGEVVAEYIDSNIISPEYSILFGRSVGSIYAIHGAYLFPNIAGLIIESGISDVLARVLLRLSPKEIDSTIHELILEDKKYFDHEMKMRKFQGKTLILHSRNNTLVPSNNAVALYKQANEPKSLHLFARGDHNDIFYTNYNDYISLVDDFIANI